MEFLNPQRRCWMTHNPVESWTAPVLLWPSVNGSRMIHNYPRGLLSSILRVAMMNMVKEKWNAEVRDFTETIRNVGEAVGPHSCPFKLLHEYYIPGTCQNKSRWDVSHVLKESRGIRQEQDDQCIHHFRGVHRVPGSSEQLLHHRPAGPRGFLKEPAQELCFKHWGGWTEVEENRDYWRRKNKELWKLVTKWRQYDCKVKLQCPSTM